ncbi:hypothetical protein EUGRSUZ_C01393 [Eucalyptus grandis]|uniref:Uncharacterized protein n=2 Tax=Eucalyptus grandis TaxID=71139 RepID=A0ACC3LDI2_EUCGR|nr:hypothetical protein EUGRSUZ_C01393 [Eucalyptus grandis]
MERWMNSQCDRVWESVKLPEVMEFALRTCSPSPRSITRETLCGFVRDVEETSSPMWYRLSSREMDFWTSLDKAGRPGTSF